MVCTQKGVINLLNRTPLAGRQVTARYLARLDGTRLDLGRLRRCRYYGCHVSHATPTPSAGDTLLDSYDIHTLAKRDTMNAIVLT